MTEEQPQAPIEVQRYSVCEGWIVADEGGRLVTYEAFLALAQRAEAAEAKLAERNKQRNPDYFLNRIESSDKWGPEVELRIYESQLDASKSQDDHGGGIIELFTRPAPAADLAELVPVVTRLKRRYVCNEGRESEFIACVTPERSSIGTGQVWDDWRELSAILRNIEESK